MAEFLELVETLQAEAASVRRLFEGEGTGAAAWRRSRAEDPRYKEALAEAATLVADVLTGRRPSYLLREALGTSDFPLLFGDILDRQLLAAYREAPATYRAYVKVVTVPDFRQVSRFAVDGGDAVLAPVPPQSEYPETSLSESRDQYAVAKYGRRIPFSWEAIINDDLEALRDIPERFGRAARRSEERFATELFVDANGPHAQLYQAGRNNIVTGNPPLSVAALEDALTQLANQKDPSGEPILLDAVHLVVPPSLEITAHQIVNTVERRIQQGTDNLLVVRGNGLPRNLQVHVNRYIPAVASNANGSTSWFLFGEPSDSRPALEMGFLRGHTEPEIFIKAPNAQRVGGGAAAPLDGDFDTDAIQYKVRHVFGGARLVNTGGWRTTVASNGSGV